ncbi:tyrosine-type recombinase/integrase [Thioalkalivibrio sulfidiphilus]|uniref:tyrosine-type recombinase/integrase n=1 Tax=Thioalkalivibrio sulfidiphilus TaxID=1033854 RepID=UPI0003625A84|nr:site-specific integrase [Thioalkalivibrio sulfidiphilus]
MPTLTDTLLRRLEPPAKGKRIIFDDHRDAPRGFGVRITSAGTVTFLLRYNVNGRDRLLTIGQWPKPWSLAAARKQAHDFRKQIDAGHDILEERRADRDEPTLSDALSRYFAAHVDKLKSGPAIRATLERYLVPPLGKMKLKDVRRRDVIEVLETLAHKYPRQAALLLTYTKGLFAWAEDREIIEANPVATIKPRKVAKAMTPKSRARVLSNQEILDFWTHAETCGLHRLTALALKLILITGQRPGEVAGMSWSEVDGNLWTIPASRRGKTDTSHTVPLTTTALEILKQARAEGQRLAKRRKRAAGFVFEARPGTPVTTAALGRAVGRFVEALGNQNKPEGGHWTPHDLRRTCRTGLAALGVSETVAEATIGHTRKGIAAVYDLHRYDLEKRTALEAWERRLHRIIEGRTVDDNVVPLRQA